MSYHEYINQNGNLSRRHNNGRRTTPARDAINTIEDVYQNARPDSTLWQKQAEFTLGALGNLLGTEAYTDWHELVWPENEIESYTWKQICDMAEAAFFVALTEKRDLSKLVNAAKSKIAQDSELA